MGLFILVGIISLAVGFSFIFAPEMLRKINQKSAVIVSNIESKAFDYRVGLGLSLIIASLLFFFVAYYIHVRG